MALHPCRLVRVDAERALMVHVAQWDRLEVARLALAEASDDDMMRRGRPRSADAARQVPHHVHMALPGGRSVHGLFRLGYGRHQSAIVMYWFAVIIISQPETVLSPRYSADMTTTHPQADNVPMAIRFARFMEGPPPAHQPMRK